MRLLLAARLSQVSDGQTGIETQDQDAHEWAKVNDHEIIAVAADKKSGTKAMSERPNLRPWVTDPGRIVQYDGIVAAKTDRLSRAKWRDETEIRRWAEDNGKELFIVSPELHWPPANMAEQLSWEIFAVQAHEEWKNTSQRYRRMQAHLRENDFLVGRAPFGYVVVCAESCGLAGSECKHHKTLAVDKARRKYVEDMFARYLAGDSLTAICEWLDSAGCPPTGGGLWTQKSVAQILRNPVYAGRRVDAKGKTILKVEPIIDAVTFKRTLAKLDSAPRKRGAVSGETAMLTGILACGKCGGPMYRIKPPGRDYFYRCTGTARQPSKCRNLIPLADADSYVSMWVTDVIGRKELIGREVTPASGHDEAIASVEMDIRELDLDDPEYDAKLSALRAERKRLKELPAEASKVVERPTGVTLAEHWASLSTTQAKRAWLLAGEVKVMASKEGFTLRAMFGRDWTVSAT